MERGILFVEGIELYAYHGCLKEESVVGNRYRVDVKIEGDFMKAAGTDNLNDTIDYTAVYNAVVEEMSQRSNLIEHVAKRIIDKLKPICDAATTIEVKISKYNPPVNGTLEKTAIVFRDRVD